MKTFYNKQLIILSQTSGKLFLQEIKKDKKTTFFPATTALLKRDEIPTVYISIVYIVASRTVGMRPRKVLPGGEKFCVLV